MPTTLATRKPVEDLGAADFEAFPVWEFALDEEGAGDDDAQDETWVRPVAAIEVPAGAGSLGVAAALRLAGGLVYPGVLFCDTPARSALADHERADPEHANPAYAILDVSAVALLTTAGRVLFARGDTPAETRRALKRLGLPRAQVFPLEYATRAPLAGSGAPGYGSFQP
jgi:hypothetical protein